MKNKIAVVISDYYKEITNGLTDGFNLEINKNFDVSLYYVTGA